MPGLSGFETAEKVRVSDKKVIIIFVTAIEELWEDGYSVQAFTTSRSRSMSKFRSVFRRAVDKIQEERRPVTIQTMSGLLFSIHGYPIPEKEPALYRFILL